MYKSTQEINEKDIYEIYDIDGEKWIHFLGYIYCAQDAMNEKHFRILEYCGFECKLEEYFAEPSIYEYYASEVNTYIEDATEEEALGAVNTWFNGLPPIPLDLENATMDISCGQYIGWLKEW